MERLFDTHRIRSRRELDGYWNINAKGEAHTQQLEWEGSALVPSVVESIPGLEDFRGTVTYSKKFELSQIINASPKPEFYRFVCKGVSFSSSLKIDGKEIARHYNAYTAFDGIVSINSDHVTAVIEANNEFGPKSALHFDNDYYSYCGIIRPVIVEVVPRFFIEYIHFTPRETPDGWWATIEVSVRDCLASTSAAEQMNAESFCLRLFMDDGEFGTLDFGNKADTKDDDSTRVVFQKDFYFGDVEPYTQRSPRLHHIMAVLEENGTATDDLIDRVGFRSVEVRGNEVYFGQEKLHFVGFNRHEDSPQFGSALPVEMMALDLQIMRDLGATSVRTSHYPNDERFLDMCDELGMLVWEEAHWRGKEPQGHNPLVLQQTLDCIHEMVTEHYNHPAIYTWGIFNEYDSNTEDGAEMYRVAYQKLGQLDASRPKTSATMHALDGDLCLGMADIVSVNIYPQWYLEESTAMHLRRVRDAIALTDGRDKPLIVSEIGAGALPGFRDVRRSKWSEERQSDILSEQLTALMEDQELVGVYIWQFCDVRVSEGWALARPRTMNNKGIVDEYRRPKLAYQVVKEILHSRVGQSE